MSNIYIQEPATTGKVLLKTSVGDIDIELWSKEAPKACRNFVQLCMESYYDGTIFHRTVKDFIVQGGDPTGTGTGGESIYGAPFKDEFHSRLRFVRRGLVAMANAGPNDNASQFFFTLGETAELQNKHTIFGKVVGDTLYNMLKLNEVETDGDDRPLYPHKIVSTEVLSNPFDDIVPRVIKKVKKDKADDKKIKSKSKATKNFSLLSFGEEAEEDEEQTFKASKKFSGKSKSSHDLTDDPRLSSIALMESASGESSPKRKQDETSGEAADISSEEVRKKLKTEVEPAKIKSGEEIQKSDKKSRSEEIRNEAKKLKKELKAAKKKEAAPIPPVLEPMDGPEEGDQKESAKPGDFLESFKQERQKYKSLKKMQKKPGEDREAQTLALLAKFQNKLSAVRQLSGYSDSEGEENKEKTKPDNEEEEDDVSDASWLKHKLHFEESEKRVLDANVTDVDRYEIHDPRNPMTKRRRDAGKKKSKHKKDDA